jgi:hypothetical protein
VHLKTKSKASVFTTNCPLGVINSCSRR